ncbi:hypothetical protein N2152v2_000254 [Parachlorella kessleri]
MTTMMLAQPFVRPQARSTLLNLITRGRASITLQQHANPWQQRRQRRRWCAAEASPSAGQGSDDPLYLQNGKPHIASSLFRPFEKLPPDGKTLTPEDEGCDPEKALCKTKIHVWETKCRACFGSGVVVMSGRRGRRTKCICLQCTGLGYVRHTSSNVEPVQDAEDNEAYYTLARPVPVEPKSAAKKHRSAAQHVTRPRHRHH